MAAVLSTAVVQETVSQILSGIVHWYEGKEKLNANENLERLEIAHIKLEAALETSGKWMITDASLLRWRKKLKRAAQECNDTVHKCKKRILEDEQMEQEVRNSSLHKQIAHATKSIIFSVFSRNDYELSRSTVQRFEWFADGASEFLRFIELGGTPCRHIPFGSLVKNLFAGKELHHKIVRGNMNSVFQLLLVPYSTEHGIEATLVCTHKDGTPPEGNIYFTVLLQLSESTNIVGIAIKCLQLFAPVFKCTLENTRNELTQLPTQDFSWVPSVYSRKKEHWDNLRSLASQWFRPSPLCCKQHDWHEIRRISNLDMAGSSDVSLEPVIQVVLQCQVSLSVDNKQKTSLSEGKISPQDYPYLKAAISFAPHGSSEDMLPVNKSSAIVAMVGEEQHCLHTDISWEQLEGIMLPKAIDYFHQNTEAAVYQMIWSSKHSSALIQFEKASMSTRRSSMGTRRTSGGARKRKLLQGKDQELRSRMRTLSHRLINLWGAQVPVQLRSMFTDWMQKEK